MMLDHHPLIRRARRTAVPSESPVPSDASYDTVRGAWADARTGELIVRSPGTRPQPQTKKEDIERAEDQKGF